jgi:hypothetical protein
MLLPYRQKPKDKKIKKKQKKQKKQKNKTIITHYQRRPPRGTND